jgi:hypothetical protein
MGLVRDALLGTVAGAAGTAALNISTYADMAARGRPSSDVPATLVKSVASSAGVDLLAADEDTAANRRSGIGALLGYANGLGLGAIYGAVRPWVRTWVPLPLAGLVIGAAAMAMSDVPATRAGATDPATWGTAGWIADIVPHAIFGLVLAGTFESIDSAATM